MREVLMSNELAKVSRETPEARATQIAAYLEEFCKVALPPKLSKSKEYPLWAIREVLWNYDQLEGSASAIDGLLAR
jgi:hypothetical protein